MGARRSRKFWEKLRAEVIEGGGVSAVARRRGVNARTLSWWCWRLRREGARRADEGGLRLLPIEVRDVERVNSHGSVVLEVGDVRIVFESGTDAAYVGALAAAVRSSC
jgi:transposase-like protein